MNPVLAAAWMAGNNLHNANMRRIRRGGGIPPDDEEEKKKKSTSNFLLAFLVTIILFGILCGVIAAISK